MEITWKEDSVAVTAPSFISCEISLVCPHHNPEDKLTNYIIHLTGFTGKSRFFDTQTDDFDCAIMRYAQFLCNVYAGGNGQPEPFPNLQVVEIK